MVPLFPSSSASPVGGDVGETVVPLTSPTAAEVGVEVGVVVVPLPSGTVSVTSSVAFTSSSSILLDRLRSIDSVTVSFDVAALLVLGAKVGVRVGAVVDESR